MKEKERQREREKERGRKKYIILSKKKFNIIGQ
jgi:hypothetical protein